jgi:phospholipid/cholesterol/gamma-HCH transport system permease protein
MNHQTEKSSASFEMQPGPEGGTIIRIVGTMDQNTAPHLIKSISGNMVFKTMGPMIVDLEQTTYFDDYGALVLSEIRRFASVEGGFEIRDPGHKTDGILSFVDLTAFDPPKTQPVAVDGFIEQIGQAALTRLSGAKTMVAFLGSVFISFVKIIANPKSLRLNDTILTMEKTGVHALPIVALISFLLGLVMAFMSSIQLQQFGANIYVASLVAIAMVSELGPIMTAIVVSGRSGSAFAAEIGAMKISEEIDALSTMGFDPVSFLAIPRILASVVVVPILTVFSDIFAILGGLAVGVFLLDLTVSSYMTETFEILTFFEISWGLMKSVVFSLLISWVGCLRGFQARGGADAVGNAATSAVVSGIFLIIVFDSFFAILRSQW